MLLWYSLTMQPLGPKIYVSQRDAIPSAVGSRLPLKTRLRLVSYRVAASLCLSVPWGPKLVTLINL